jgi:hypothetical protein
MKMEQSSETSLLSGYPIAYTDGTVFQNVTIKWISTRLYRWNSVPKRRLLSGYPLAYEDGTDTVFRNASY